MEQKAIDFKNQYDQQHIDEDGYYGAQCWDVVARYAREKYGCPSFPTGSGGAEGLFRIHADPIPRYFDVVANNPNDPNQIPPNGAIIVWSGTWSPPWGHTAIKLAGGKGQLMTVFEQNGNNPGGVAYVKQRNYTGVSGWLVPKVNNNEGSTAVIIGNDQGWRDRMNRFHHQLVYNADISEAVFQSTVGKELAQVLVQWSDHSNADNLTHEQEVGELAIHDQWQQQIYDRTAERDSALKAVAQANADLTAARQALQDLNNRPTQAKLDALTAQLQAAEKRAMEAQADYEKVKSDLDAKVQQDSKADEATTGFLRALWRKITGGN